VRRSPRRSCVAIEAAGHARHRPAARAAAVAFARVAGAGPDLLGDVALAVTEACANAVVHAYADVAAPGDVELRSASPATSWSSRSSTRAAGMKHRADAPGLGMGLAVIAGVT
jgi:anti-sigma regulatory factor (Ser/Thr protein kinase)